MDLHLQERFGPWELGHHRVEIRFEPRPRLRASRGSRALTGFPLRLRRNEEHSWLLLALEAAQDHYRAVRDVLERAMVDQAQMGAPDLEWLRGDPAGRVLLECLLVAAPGGAGFPDLRTNTLLTLDGRMPPLSPPWRVVHPVELMREGNRQEWNAFLNRSPISQPFRQIRREVWQVRPECREWHAQDDLAGVELLWQQARAIWERRGWYRVTATGAERYFPAQNLVAYVELRRPPSLPKPHCLSGRVYFLPEGELPHNRERPGVPLGEVDPVVYSETMRDVALVCTVASRGPASSRASGGEGR